MILKLILFTKTRVLAAIFFLSISVMTWACKSDSGCSNGSDCDLIAGNAYTNSSTSDGITTNTTITFNDDGTFNLSYTYTGTGAPANCASSGEWSLEGQALGITTNSSDCEGDELYVNFVFELIKTGENEVSITGRWLSGGMNGPYYKQNTSSAWAGSYSFKNYAQPTTLTMTASANPDSGTFQFTGDYTQSGTWVASFSTANFTGTAGTGWNSTFSLTMNSSTSYYTRQ